MVVFIIILSYQDIPCTCVYGITTPTRCFVFVGRRYVVHIGREKKPTTSVEMVFLKKGTKKKIIIIILTIRGEGGGLLMTRRGLGG